MTTIRDIYEIAAGVFNVPLADLFGPSRKRYIVRARQAAWLVIRRMTDKTFPEIAMTARRDHSTIIHGVHWALDFAQKDQDFAAKITAMISKAKLRTLLRSQPVVYYARRKPFAYQDAVLVR